MNRNVFIYNGIWLLFTGAALTAIQTKAWGGHFIPESTPEAICDLISALWLFLAAIFLTIGNALPKSK
jgi:hypothetical protein